MWEASVCTCLARLCLCLVLRFLSEKLEHVGTKAFDKLGLPQKTSKFPYVLRFSTPTSLKLFNNLPPHQTLGKAWPCMGPEPASTTQLSFEAY